MKDEDKAVEALDFCVHHEGCNGCPWQDLLSNCWGCNDKDNRQKLWEYHLMTEEERKCVKLVC